MAAPRLGGIKALPHGGLLKYVHDREDHCFNPDVVQSLQAAVKSGDYTEYQRFARLVNERPVATLRDLLAVQPAAAAIPLSGVEPQEDFYRRFHTQETSFESIFRFAVVAFSQF